MDYTILQRWPLILFIPDEYVPEFAPLVLTAIHIAEERAITTLMECWGAVAVNDAEGRQN